MVDIDPDGGASTPEVLTCRVTWLRLIRLAARYGVPVKQVEPGAPIPGTYWGEPEAGILNGVLHARPDTPVHSFLHELGHIVCADAVRRAGIRADAGGEDIEESGVCRSARPRAAGSSSTLKVRLPGSDHQALAPRPRPRVCRSARTTIGRPEGVAGSITQLLARSLVESTSSNRTISGVASFMIGLRAKREGRPRP